MLFRTAWLSVAVTMVMGLAAASHADDWGTVVAISSTMGVHGDRVCVGEATRGDIGCPTYAPYVSATSGFMGIGTNSPTTALDVNGRIRTNNEIISNPTASAEGGHLILAYPTSSTISGQGNGTWNVDVFSDKSLRLFRRDVSGVALTPFQIFENGNVGIGKGASTQLDVSGTVSATRFVGDGSQLTGVVASTADRIVSGTTSLLAVSSTGFVSLTQAGTNTGWFDPTRGLVTLGVSATGAVSGSRGYFREMLVSREADDRSYSLVVSGSVLVTNTAAGASLYIGGMTGSVEPGLRLHYLPTGGPRGAYIDLQGPALNFRRISQTAPTEIAETVLSINGGEGGRTLSVSGSTSIESLVSTTQAQLTVRSGNSRVYIGHPLQGFAQGTGNGGAIYFGPDPYSSAVTDATAGIETNWGSSTTTPQIHMGVLRGNSLAYYSAYYGRVLTMSTSGTERVRIDGNGNVGIGLSPAYPLDVSGTIRGRQGLIVGPAGSNFEVTYTSVLSTPIYGLSSQTASVLRGPASANLVLDLLNNQSSDAIAFRHSAANNSVPDSIGFIYRGDGKVGIGGIVTVTTALEVSGTVSATRFMGDGSGLTNIAGASADRIVSGTTSLLAMSSTGFVSLTQAGTNTGWFDPTRGLVTLGVSATGRISATSGYFTSGIVISSPVAYRAMVYKTNGLNRWQLSTNNSAETGSNAGSDFFIQYADDAGIWSGIPLFVRRGNGNIGMNTTDPSQTLHVAGSALTTSWTGINFSAANVTPTAPLEVSGTVSATYVKLADNDDVPCTPERKGTLRFSNGIVSICRAQ